MGNVVNLPLQMNFNTGGGLEDNTGLLLNFQPVVPVAINARWNLIARGIVPLIDSVVGDQTFRGLGDIQAQLLLTPARRDDLVWGLGPMFSFPTATTGAARTGSWAFGPAAVVVKTKGPWVIGGLASQLWTYADEGGAPEVDLFSLQPFVNYNFGRGWALASAPIFTANFDAPDGQEWTVPLGLGVTRTMVWQGQPLSMSVQYYHNVERPDAAAADQLRFVLSFLFPSAS